MSDHEQIRQEAENLAGPSDGTLPRILVRDWSRAAWAKAWLVLFAELEQEKKKFQIRDDLAVKAIRSAEIRLAKADKLAETLQRIAATCDVVVKRIAEVGEPPPWLSGTQLDPERVANIARAALTDWEKR